MKMNEIFKMVKAANKLNQLLGEKEKIIEIRIDERSMYYDFETFAEFKEWLNEEYVDEVIEQVLNADYKQIKNEPYYFETEWKDYKNEVCISEIHISTR